MENKLKLCKKKLKETHTNKEDEKYHILSINISNIKIKM